MRQRPGLDRFTLQWLCILAFCLVCIALKPYLDFITAYPADWQLPLAETLNAGMAWFLSAFDGAFKKFFRGIAWFLSFPVNGMSDFLKWIPWPVLIALVVIVAHRASGRSLAIFSFCAMVYMLIIGHWDKSMNSLALVALSVPLAVMIGFVLGVLGFYSPRSERFIMPLLDLLQTIPAFAYLIPIIILFGFGPVVGLIASIMFAVAPMVRNTIVGLRAVPPEVIESGQMSGTTPLQLFFQVRVPSALKQILLGVNQTTMAALSMVIIASIIGGTDDIGWEVLSGIRKALFGESLLAGIVIALIAMIMDRITVGLATRQTDYVEHASFTQRHPYLIMAVIATVILWTASLLIPALAEYPESWVISMAQPLNDGIAYIVLNWREAIAAIKTTAFFYMMLPAKIGLVNTISPYSWGFELNSVHIIAYTLMMLAAAFALWRWVSKPTAIALCVFAIIFYFGLTNLPWPGFMAIIALMAYQLGGKKLAIGVLLGLLFLLVAGVWPEAMMSVYLCGLAVMICFVIGATLGILMSENDRFSAFMRPINDTLQTMPLFVLLIPAVMIFKLGDFTALIAIVIYAIVPMIRYTEHALRNLPKEVMEAATSMGTTKWQLLFQVKLPLALPVIMLGLNQTVLYAVAMLVITALVGTSDLGQKVYIGLGDGDFGVGIVAGLGMAILAIITDRIIQAAAKRQQEATGLTAD
ncbi:MAG: ABC transporter permease [Thiolinea sp.]